MEGVHGDEAQQSVIRAHWIAHNQRLDSLDLVNEIISTLKEDTMTIVAQLQAAQADIQIAKDALGGGTPEAAREFALANTAIEDAIMRVNRAFAHRNGTFAVADVEGATL